MSSERDQMIEEILSDLKNLTRDPSLHNQYAVKENIGFFSAARSPLTYFFWMFKKASKLDKERLLELSDLPLPRWDKEMHKRLIQIEKKNFPGLLKPLVRRIIDFITENDRDLILSSLGCGGMELERQVISELIKKKHDRKTTFIGIDKSEASHELAKENLKELVPPLNIYERKSLDQFSLSEFLNSVNSQYSIILCKNDIFELTSKFKPRTFDVIYHSLFRHHLDQEQKKEVGRVIASLARKQLEYDGYKTWSVILPQTLTTWKSPVLLGATIFSDLRYQEKKEVIVRSKGGHLSFYKIGTYLLEKDS